MDCEKVSIPLQNKNDISDEKEQNKIETTIYSFTDSFLDEVETSADRINKTKKLEKKLNDSLILFSQEIKDASDRVVAIIFECVLDERLHALLENSLVRSTPKRVYF